MNYDKFEFVEMVEELVVMYNFEVFYEVGNGFSQIECY